MFDKQNVIKAVENNVRKMPVRTSSAHCISNTDVTCKNLKIRDLGKAGYLGFWLIVT